MATIIGEVRHKVTARVGESVEFEVLGSDGQPLTFRDDVNVRLDGVTGARQFLQFATPGTHKVAVTASRRDGAGRRESRYVTVRVAYDAPDATELTEADGPLRHSSFPLLRAVSSSFRPNHVTFSLVEPAQAQPARDATSSHLGDSSTSAMNLGTERSTTRSPDHGGDARYRWTFGNAYVFESTTPYAQHDFEDSLDPATEWQTFHVQVEIIPASGSSYQVKRSLSVLNAYALCKRFGGIVPRVYHNAVLRRVGEDYEALLAVKNVENFALTLTTRRVDASSLDANAGSDEALKALEPPVQLGANQVIFLAVPIAASEISEQATSVSIHLGGHTGTSKHRVHVEAVFDVPPHTGRASSAVPRAASLADDRSKNKLGADKPNASVRIVDACLASASSTTLANKLNEVARWNGEPRAGQAEEKPASDISLKSQHEPCKTGQECDPAFPITSGDCRCLMTLERRKVRVPGRFVNTHKGDIILLAGGVDSIVGNLLRRVRPAQYYDHCVMVTKDQTVNVAVPGSATLEAQEITHSTVCFKRLTEASFWIGDILGIPFPRSGIREDVIKYIWPGVITQRTETAVNPELGEPLRDPETGKEYRLTPMNPYENVVELQGNWEVTPPLVVRPDPLHESRETRSALHKVADYARSLEGQMHYRLYGYSQAAVIDTPAPKEAGWAADSYGSMCSSFLWQVARKNGVTFEGDLERDEKERGVMRDDLAPDGLYLYDEAERLEAGQYVAEYIRRQVTDQADAILPGAGLLQVVQDAATKVANQVVNAFVSDTGGEEGLTDKWRTPKSGSTVSPDDIMLWDSPDKGGLFGYITPALYRPSYEMSVPVYRWQKVQGTGGLEGAVRYRGALVEGAEVSIPGFPTVHTDASGRFNFATLPVGTHEIYVAKMLGDQLRAAHEYAQVVTTQNVHDIELKTSWRKLSVTGTVQVQLKDDWNRPKSKTMQVDYSANLSSLYPHVERTFEILEWRGARVKLTIGATWSLDQTLAITLACDAAIGESKEANKLSLNLASNSSTALSDWGAKSLGVTISLLMSNSDTKTD